MENATPGSEHTLDEQKNIRNGNEGVEKRKYS